MGLLCANGPRELALCALSLAGEEEENSVSKMVSLAALLFLLFASRVDSLGRYVHQFHTANDNETVRVVRHDHSDHELKIEVAATAVMAAVLVGFIIVYRQE